MLWERSSRCTLPSCLLTPHPLPAPSLPHPLLLSSPHPSPLLLPLSLPLFHTPYWPLCPAGRAPRGDLHLVSGAQFAELSACRVERDTVTIFWSGGPCVRSSLPNCVYKAAPCTAWWSPCSRRSRGCHPGCPVQTVGSLGTLTMGEGCLSRGPGPVAPVGA